MYKTVIKTKQLDYIDRLFDDATFNLNDISVDKYYRTKTYKQDVPIPPSWNEQHDASVVQQRIDNICEICNNFEGKPEEMYYEFKIPKRTGGFRTIDAPNPELKEAQYKILYELKRMRIQAHDSAWAYIKGRDIVGALKEHQANNSRWFLKLDLKDFFGSCTREVIKERLGMLYPFAFMDTTHLESLTGAISFIGMKEGKLPQGTPLSPYLTNLLMVSIDYEINHLLNDVATTGLKKQKYVYTRYADDILISAKESFDWNHLVIMLKEHIFAGTGFTIKDEKTRYGSNAGRNWNLGVMYNKDNQLTVGTKRKKQLKQSIYNFINNSESFSIEDVQVLLGQLSWLRNVEPEYFEGLMQYYLHKIDIDIWNTLITIIRNAS